MNKVLTPAWHSSPSDIFFNQRLAPTAKLLRGGEMPAVILELLDKPLSYFKELATLKAGPLDLPLTQVAFALDVSGSMSTGKEATIAGFNHQLKVVREGATIAGETLYTEVHFGSEVAFRCTAASLEHLKALDNDTYVPQGMTSLHDAIGDTIAALLATPRIGSPATATLLTIFTDGDDTYSKRYSTEALKALVERLAATGRWTFALVGPSGSVNALADLLSINRSNVAGYNPSSVAERTRAFEAVALASCAYMSARSVGSTQARGLYASENKKEA
jgi:hypothetical protein